MARRISIGCLSCNKSDHFVCFRQLSKSKRFPASTITGEASYDMDIEPDDIDVSDTVTVVSEIV